ncbi:MAG: EamA family transporter [Neisseriaceae bacterium]
MWFWYAIMASALWGISYVVNQVLMSKLNTLEIILFESTFIVVLFIPWLFFNYGLKSTLMKYMDIKLILLLLCSSSIYLLASVFILKSIGSSNATLASIIEASYPIFTVIFAYIFLGQKQFNMATLVGCSFIILGLIIVQQGGK